MKDLKISWKQIFFITLGITLFENVIDPTTFFGLGSLFLTFVFFLGWFNYIIYKLDSKQASKAEKIFSELYFTILFLSSLLYLSTIIFRYSLGDIVTKGIMFILSPYFGIRFLLRPISGWIVLVLVINLLMILVIRYMTKNDSLNNNLDDDEYDEEIVDKKILKKNDIKK